MVRIINGEVVSADPSRRNSRSNSSHTTPIIGSSLSSAASPMLPPLTLPSSAVSSSSSTHSSHHTTPRHSSSTPSSSGVDTPSPMLSSSSHHTSSTTSPPPLGLGSSVQHTNPYLSATAYGGAPLTSGHGFHDGSSPSPQAVTAHDLGLAHAQAQAYAAAYYLHGLLGPGFILGHAAQPTPQPPQQQQQQQQQQPSSQPPLHPQLSSTTSSLSSPLTPSSVTPLSSTAPNSPPFASRSLSNSSSSCPSPLLTSTSERRKSKPHIQFVPPTHTVTSTGLVVPVAPPPSLSLDGSHPRSSNLHSNNSSSARVSHAFNLFGLPPLFVYEIRIPPHVYLLTGLILYLIGPPALIPLVACFFFYRWHLQQKSSHANHHNQGAHPPLNGANGSAASSKAAAIAAGHASMNRHPSGVPKAQPSPLVTQRRHPNIHSLYDTQ